MMIWQEMWNCFTTLIDLPNQRLFSHRMNWCKCLLFIVMHKHVNHFTGHSLNTLLIVRLGSRKLFLVSQTILMYLTVMLKVTSLWTAVPWHHLLDTFTPISLPLVKSLETLDENICMHSCQNDLFLLEQYDVDWPVPFIEMAIPLACAHLKLNWWGLGKVINGVAHK